MQSETRFESNTSSPAKYGFNYTVDAGIKIKFIVT